MRSTAVRSRIVDRLNEPGLGVEDGVEWAPAPGGPCAARAPALP
ncbi:MAG TPA: hypothetical protein VH134_02750 [Candidatus Dormibacteraeota bacterium]|nr:hypothetical protein [Candidatus Dormibacteraeota bacterium]